MFKVTIRMALRALTANALRTSLSVLGIVIGISCVVALMSIGEGQRQDMLKMFEYFGTNQVTVWPEGSGGGGRHEAFTGSSERRVRFRLEDADYLRDNARSIKEVSPEAGTNGRVKYLSNSVNCSVNGVTDVYFDVSNWKLFEGRLIEPADISTASRVVVLGFKAAENLFGTASPLGMSIQINGKAFTTIGVLDEKGAFNSRWNPDEDVFIPITTCQRSLIGSKDVQSFTVTTWNLESTAEAEMEIADILGRRYNLPLGREEEFIGIWNSGERQKEREATAKTISTFLSIVAAITLLIGGIGIMNIMLVSVTERTREIGLRKALGAKRRTILTQFLIESLIICIWGALLGVGLGIVIVKILSNLPEESQFPPPVLQVQFIFVAVIVSVLVALVFGFFPAVRASSLKPIEALRYE
jgi:putative ABC transport system permease protein